ncbi:hypothetical protein LOK49_Contig7G00005 [Camellia lanceoleosa]|nr:hypothetical protein LOK49_Contig7G00005 [Camellia lanceoleosa]
MSKHFEGPQIWLKCGSKLPQKYFEGPYIWFEAECNGVRNIGLADCISSSKVEFSRAEENDCKGKDGVGLVAKQFVLDDAVMPSSIEVVQRKELSHCNSREVVDTAVEETRCDVEEDPFSEYGLLSLEIQASCRFVPWVFRSS